MSVTTLAASGPSIGVALAILFGCLAAAGLLVLVAVMCIRAKHRRAAARAKEDELRRAEERRTAREKAKAAEEKQGASAQKIVTAPPAPERSPVKEPQTSVTEESAPEAYYEEALPDEPEPIAANAEQKPRFGKKTVEVSSLSPEAREKLGLADESFDGKTMYVRSSLGFDGKLCNAEPETKERFVRFMNNVCAYKKVRVGGSFTKRRISSGRKTLALVAFSGKKIAVAFALDPKRFEDTPYRGKDKSELKRYADTPLLIKLSSERRTEHAIKLFDILAGEVGLVRDENVVPPEYDLVQKSQKELFYGGLLRVKVCGEVVEEQTEVRVSPKKATAPKPVKKQAAVSVDEAKTLLSDEDAAKLVKGKFKRKNGKKFAVNIDTVAAAFKAGERVDIKSLKAKGLVPPSAKQIKVLGRGYIDKPLKVVADDFSYAALKMIIVTGGEAVYCE